jgi:hypothetical protein
MRLRRKRPVRMIHAATSHPMLQLEAKRKVRTPLLPLPCTQPATPHEHQDDYDNDKHHHVG